MRVARLLWLGGSAAGRMAAVLAGTPAEDAGGGGSAVTSAGVLCLCTVLLACLRAGKGRGRLAEGAGQHWEAGQTGLGWACCSWLQI